MHSSNTKYAQLKIQNTQSTKYKIRTAQQRQIGKRPSGNRRSINLCLAAADTRRRLISSIFPRSSQYFISLPPLLKIVSCLRQACKVELVIGILPVYCSRILPFFLLGFPIERSIANWAITEIRSLASANRKQKITEEEKNFGGMILEIGSLLFWNSAIWVKDGS